MIRYRFLIVDEEKASKQHGTRFMDKVVRYGSIAFFICVIPFMIALALPFLLLALLVGLLGVGVVVYRVYRLRSLLRDQANTFEEVLHRAGSSFENDPCEGSIVEGEVERRVIKPKSFDDS